MKTYDLHMDSLQKESKKAQEYLATSVNTLERALQAGSIDEDIVDDCVNTCVLAYENCLNRSIDLHLYQRKYKNAASST